MHIYTIFFRGISVQLNIHTLLFYSLAHARSLPALSLVLSKNLLFFFPLRSPRPRPEFLGSGLE